MKILHRVHTGGIIMKKNILAVVFVAALLPFHSASAGIITAANYADDIAFSAATGATSLTGALPDLGSVGTSITLGDATLSAGNTIFVGSGWSSLLPDGNAIAISGPENLSIDIDVGLSRAFGFYFHEPMASTAALDGCNVTVCVDSTFLIEFFLDGNLIDGANYNGANDVAEFYGFTLDMSFNSVRFTETVGTNDNEFFGEMYRAQVPEPSSLLLIAAGLVGFALLRRFTIG